MSKRRPAGDGNASAGNGTRLRALDELASLRLELAAKPTRTDTRTATAGPGQKKHKRSTQTDKTDAPAFDGAFGDALQGVTPLRSPPRIEIDRPKPPPVPRRRAPEPEEAPQRRARDDRQLEGSALFRATIGDVKPLRSSNQADTHAPKPLPHARGDAADMMAGKQAALNLLLPPEGTEVPAEELFRLATRGAQPLGERNLVEHAQPLPAPAPRQSKQDDQAALRETMEAPLTFEDRLDMGEEAAFIRPGLPKRVLVDLRRGRWVLQGELDLHGLTREEAREALARFLAASLSRGRRCVRIIHGKGLGSPGKLSILKQLSRGWLAQREEILAFCQAGAHQGGSGALTVLLRAPNATPPTRHD